VIIKQVSIIKFNLLPWRQKQIVPWGLLGHQYLINRFFLACCRVEKGFSLRLICLQSCLESRLTLFLDVHDIRVCQVLARRSEHATLLSRRGLGRNFDITKVHKLL
jgi:hypothetical protein